MRLSLFVAVVVLTACSSSEQKDASIDVVDVTAIEARDGIASETASMLDAAVDDVMTTDIVDGGSTPWRMGALDVGSLPPRNELLALPGGADGNPVVTSNNPEIFQGAGLLFGTGRASALRGGSRLPLDRFGVYVHHINGAGSVRYVSVIVTNPNTTVVRVDAQGSGYTQTETGGLGLGTSPDYRVSEEWIRGQHSVQISQATVMPQRPLLLWQRAVNPNAEIDGRFRVSASAPVLAYVVVTQTADLNDVVTQSTIDAPGVIARSGTPPPPFGREAGVYAADTWRGAWTVESPPEVHAQHVGWMVNTATGAGLSPVQAFPALMHYTDSAAESVGMYGNVYDLTLRLRCSAGVGACRFRVWFASLITASISRYWDGVGLVDGVPVVISQTPAQRATVLARRTVGANTEQVVHFQAMVPGLTTIPQAVYVELE